MAIILEAVGADGAVQRVPLGGGVTAVRAAPSFKYRLVDDAGGKVAGSVVVKRVGNDLVVEGLSDDRSVSLQDFFTSCAPGDSCSLSMENIGGSAGEAVTPATQPVAALADGGFLMYASGSLAPAVPAAPESEGSFKPWAALLGGLAIAGVAGGGGSGGGDAASTDTIAPAAPVLTSGSFTNKTKPVFTGTAEPNSSVTLSLDVGSNGSVDVTFGTTVAADGSWTIDTAISEPTFGSLPTLAEGVPTAILARAIDAAGNTSAPTIGTVTLDTIAPPQPTITSALLTNDATPLIRGGAQPGSIVTVGLDLDRNGTVDAQWVTTAGSLGTYVVDIGSAPTSGTLPGGKLGDVSTTNLVVVASDLAGNNSPAATATLNVDTRLPPPPTISTIAGDNAINALEAASSVAISGTIAEADRPVTVQWGALTRAATVSGTSWTVTFAAGEIPADGLQTVSATYVGSAGSTSIAGTQDVLVDRLAPTAPQAIEVSESAGGISAAEAVDGVTVTVNLSGTGANAGDQLLVRWGSQPAVAYTLSGTDIGGNTATVTIDPATIAAQGDGLVGVSASIVDAVGNVGATATVPVTVDVSAPTQLATVTSVTDDLAPLTGAVASGGTTNDTAPLVGGTLSATLAAGESVQVLRDGTVAGSANVSGTTWTFADGGLANGSTYSYTARVIDGTGNIGPTGAAYTITIDATPPAQTVSVAAIADDLAPVTGTVSSGGTTNDTTPVISGTLSAALGAGEAVQVLRNGVAIGAASLSDATNWSFSDSGLANGVTYTYTGRVVDAAGNVGATSAGYSITVLTSAPTKAAPVTSITDDVAPQTGTVADGGSTNDTAPVIAGTLTAALVGGESVQVLRNGAVIGAATVAGTTWSFDDGGLTDGSSYTYAARVVDGAGNLGPTGTDYTITIDTTAPAAPTIGAVAGNDVVNGSEAAAGVTVSGTAAANSTVTVNWGATKVVGADAVGNWTLSFAAAELPADSPATTISATAADAAGNVSAAGTRSVEIDTTAPTITIADVLDDAGPLTGSVANAGTTDDSTPTLVLSLGEIFGTGASVEILRDAVPIATLTPNDTPSASFTDSALPDGTYTYTAQMTDGAGNVGLSDPYTITVLTVI